MKKQYQFLMLLTFCITQFSYGQKSKVYTADIDNFWNAYDSIRTTKDSIKQLFFLQQLFIDKGTPGLKAIMKAKDYTTQSYLYAINHYPKFWDSQRKNTYKAKSVADQFVPYIKKLKKLYPLMREASIYFTVGALNSSGTTLNDKVLIGCELATGDLSTDISELPPNYQKNLSVYFKSDPFKNVVFLNIHEYVHTQEQGPGYNLIAQCIYEGICDFTAELVTGQKLSLEYMNYGPLHEIELKKKLETEMFNPYYRGWLYNGTRNGIPGDLGYYMGYAICKKYYDAAKNKKEAIAKMIGLNYRDSIAIENFVNSTSYFDKPFSQLHYNYELNRPFVLSVFPKTDEPINPKTDEIKINFSKAMLAPYTSTDFGPLGKDHFPVIGRVGFSADGKSYTYKVSLKPDTEYEFVATGDSFRSVDGYPLKSYLIKFKTAKD